MVGDPRAGARRRGARCARRLRLRPLHGGPSGRRDRRQSVPRVRHPARRAGGSDPAGPARRARQGQHLPAPRDRGEHGGRPSTTSAADGRSPAWGPAGRSTSTAPTASTCCHPATRSDRFEETRRRWSPRCCGTSGTTFDGRFFHAAPTPPTSPAPVQDRLPVLVAGGGERRTLPHRRRGTPTSGTSGASLTRSPRRAPRSTPRCAAVGRDPGGDPAGLTGFPTPVGADLAVRTARALPRGLRRVRGLRLDGPSDGVDPSATCGPQPPDGPRHDPGPDRRRRQVRASLRGHLPAPS